MKYFKRVLFFVPVAFIHLVSVLLIWAKLMFCYAKYGGENNIYMKGDQKKIYDIYTILLQIAETEHHKREEKNI